MEYEKLLIAARYQPTTVGNMVLDPNGGYCNYQAVEILRQRVAELEKERECLTKDLFLLKADADSLTAERDALKQQRDDLLAACNEAIDCGEDGDWQSAFRILHDAIASVKEKQNDSD